ncbi:hypothetical protein VTJ04DRAFT_2187 [Mycothermus thermophilus]|uniref:uncharacterized protein n=1 Tax=Humicola insolens TaxID=85995 RepID=UPI003743BC16
MDGFVASAEPNRAWSGGNGAKGQPAGAGDLPITCGWFLSGVTIGPVQTSSFFLFSVHIFVMSSSRMFCSLAQANQAF